MPLRPEKFNSAKICPNCDIEFMPDPDDREFCKSCDPANAGVPIVTKKKVPNEDLVMEGKAEKHEKEIKQLQGEVKSLKGRVEKLENIFNAVKLPISDEENVKESKSKKEVEVKGHYPKVCPKCGEAFVAEWPAEKICNKCKKESE